MMMTTTSLGVCVLGGRGAGVHCSDPQGAIGQGSDDVINHSQVYIPQPF